MRRLAMRWVLPGGSYSVSELLELMRLAVRAVPPSGVGSFGVSKALCAWRYASPARRFGSWQRLAVRVPRQAILLLYFWVAGFACVIYKTFRIL